MGIEIVVDEEGDEPAIEFDLQPAFAVDRSAARMVGKFNFFNIIPGLEELVERETSKHPDVSRYPTALSHLLDPGFHPSWVIQWSAMVWPSRSRGYWVCAVDALLRRINMTRPA